MATFEKANALHIGDLRRYASVLLRNTGEVDDSAEVELDQFEDYVLLVALDGMSYPDVARIPQFPLGTVMSRLSRGLEAFVHGGCAGVGAVGTVECPWGDVCAR
ncbi:MAG: hypothetical protein KGI92_00175 [Alphaproteobacteria bacterium]|nr:hypothetical protein [Alphaproteobacteria bacterium]MDE2514018.1 hypothetical protein [Alphaproteobacteria bacterium]